MIIDDNHATFTLRLTGIDLDNIHPKDIGILVSEFASLLDENSLKFSNIRKGSAIVELDANINFYSQILQNFENNIIKPAYRNIQKTIRKYANLFPDIQAQFLARPNIQSENKIICTINYLEEINRILQAETLIGRLLKPAHGKDDTDHFTILLNNDEKISVKVNKDLSLNIAPHLQSLWLFESLIEFSGMAKYEMIGFQIKLKEFIANHFNIIPNNQNIENWANQFIGLGESGWQNLDNPIETWIEERH